MSLADMKDSLIVGVIIGALLFLLTGCVDSSYHAVGSPSQGLHSANIDCAWATADGSSAALGVLAGPIGGAVAGASRQDRIDQCLLARGWAKN